jgi:hypothetical protein
VHLINYSVQQGRGLMRVLYQPGSALHAEPAEPLGLEAYSVTIETGPAYEVDGISVRYRR